MAIFASTTTSGYSDPLKALSIKALEQRMKDQQAQEAAQKNDAAMMATIPGGIGHVLGVVGDQMKQARTDQALVANRDALAKIRAGMDLENPTAQNIADLGRYDPEAAKEALHMWAENRRHAATIASANRGQDVTARGQDVGANTAYRGQDIVARGQDVGANTAAATNAVTARGQDVGAATAARGQDIAVRGQDVGAATAARGQDVTARGQDMSAATTERGQDIGAATATRGQDVQVRGQDMGQDTTVRGQDMQAASATAHDATQERIAAAKAAATAAQQASDPKRAGEIATLGTQYAQQHQAVEKLEKAVGILNNGGINTGPWARAETAAAMISGGRFGTDKEMAQRTTDFNSLINEATIRTMSDTLKGQTTNFEMEKFIEVMNNPNASPEARIAGINRLLNAAKVGRDLSAEAVRKTGGNIDLINSTLSGGGAAPAAAGGGMVSGISEDEAMKLPAGTRFKLKDGRTGVAE
jgi:hypothetical protein